MMVRNFHWLLALLIGVSSACSAKKKGSSGSSSSTGDTDKGTQDTGVGTRAIDSPLGQELIALYNEVKPKWQQSEREKDRRGKLIAALTAGLHRGCAADLIIKRLEVEIQGSEMLPAAVSDAKGTYETSSVNKFTFGFYNADKSKTLGEIVHDEAAMSLFRVGGKKVFDFTSNTTFTLSDLAIVEIRRDEKSFSYTTEDICGGKQANCPSTRVKEVNRYALDFVAINANGGLPVFATGNLKIAFARYPSVDAITGSNDNTRRLTASYEEKGVKINSTYVKAMQTTDCGPYK